VEWAEGLWYHHKIQWDIEDVSDKNVSRYVCRKDSFANPRKGAGGTLEWYWLALVSAVAAIGTLAFAPLTVRIARRVNAIDYPDGRRVNTKPTPRLGGVALFVGMLLAIGVFLLVYSVMNDGAPIRGMSAGISYGGVFLSFLVIFGVGIIDDIFGIKVPYKVLGQIAAACIACASGVLFDRFTNPFDGEILYIGLLAYPITIFYLVAFANIINLIDGLDGLASGITAISALALLIISFSKGGFDAAILGAAIIGACCAFLYFNFYPARIFMGDSGSLTLGFALAVLSLFGVVRSPALVTLFIPIVIAGIPVIDTFSAIVRRLRAGRSVAAPDTEHIHHRFMEQGFSQRNTVLILYAMSALLSLGSLLMLQYRGLLRLIIMLSLVLLAVLLVWRFGLTQSVLLHYYYQRPEKRGDDGRRKRNDGAHEEAGASIASAVADASVVSATGRVPAVAANAAATATDVTATAPAAAVAAAVATTTVADALVAAANVDDVQHAAHQ
jgi:UDP-GlcNAc:undecaprenyl-phosphate GlcNAc-1-phosphate transferase